MKRLDGQVAIVTGAAQGLGRAFAVALERAGASVVSCDVDPSVCEADGVALEADVSIPDDVRRVVDSAVSRYGRIDVLVNNAGVVRLTRAGDAWDKGLADFDAIVGTNLRGAFLFGRAVAPLMRQQKSGHIVNISTDHVFPAPAARAGGHGGMDLYNASKWALNGLTLDWAASLRSSGVRVNAICMGATDTPMLRDFAGEVEDEVTRTWMGPDEVAEILIDLLAEGEGGRTGHQIGLWVGRSRTLADSREVGDRG